MLLAQLCPWQRDPAVSVHLFIHECAMQKWSVVNVEAWFVYEQMTFGQPCSKWPLWGCRLQCESAVEQHPYNLMAYIYCRKLSPPRRDLCLVHSVFGHGERDSDLLNSKLKVGIPQRSLRLLESTRQILANCLNTDRASTQKTIMNNCLRVSTSTVLSTCVLSDVNNERH